MAAEKKKRGQKHKLNLKEKYEVQTDYGPFYTGGKIQWTKDGDYLLCQSGDELQVVSMETGQKVRGFRMDEDAVVTFDLSPDNQVLVTYHKSGVFYQLAWSDLSTTRVWKSIHRGPVSLLTFDPTSTLLASGGSDSSIKVWDVGKHYCTHNLKGAAGVFSVVQFHPDMSRMRIYGATSGDPKICAWNLKTSSMVATLKGHFSTITALVFTADGNRMLSCGRDRVVIMWDLQSDTALKTILALECLEGLVLLPDGQSFPELGVDPTAGPHYITAGERGQLRTWSVALGRETIPVPPSSQPGSQLVHLSLHLSKMEIRTATHDHHICFHALSDLSQRRQMVGSNEEVLDLAFLGDSLVVATNSPVIRLYDLATWSCLPIAGHSDTVMSVASGPKPDLFASASKDRTVRIWKVADGKAICVAVGSGHTGAVGAICFGNLTATRLVTGAGDTCMKVWELDKSALRSGQEATLACVRTEVAHEKDINCVCYSPNDKIIATGSQDKTAKIWDAISGDLMGTMRGHRRGVWWTRFSPVDQVLVTASGDATIKIWAIIDQVCLKTLEGHSCSVLRVEFISRGMQLVSSASDGIVKLWNVKENECVNTFGQHDDKVWAIAVSQDEMRLATGGSDSHLVIWKDVTESERMEEEEKRDKLLQEEQTLSNLMHQGKFVKALKHAIRLDMPLKALNILKRLKLDGDGLQGAVMSLREDQRKELLRFACEWNTNGKNCHEAQDIIGVLLRTGTDDEFLSMPKSRETLEALLPYTQRHMTRLNSLARNLAFIDYVATSMKATLQPREEPAQQSKPPYVIDVVGETKVAAESTDKSERVLGRKKKRQVQEETRKKKAKVISAE